METIKLLEIVGRGEDTQHQFKEDFTNVNSLAAEMTAMANTQGGNIIIGVTDDGDIVGLSADDISRLNQIISNAASQSVKPPINPVTENITTDNGLVIVITVPEGANKPYMDNQGKIWVKSGADKRHVTSREEMQRMFQASGIVYADELPIAGTTSGDLDSDAFKAFYEKKSEQNLDDIEIPLPQLLSNLGLSRDGELNLTGLLLFSNEPQRFRPAYIIRAVAYPGSEIDVEHYIDSEDIGGRFSELYKGMTAFLLRNLHRIQAGQGVNAPGVAEIPAIVFEEILVNALVHRDYFISAPIRLFIFRDRIEVISPGHLPNHLTTEQIRCGLSNMRNPRLASHASNILPYRGMGTGIPRALKIYSHIEFIEDREANQFTVIIQRPDGGH